MSQQKYNINKFDAGVAIAVAASFIVGFILSIAGGITGLINGSLANQASCSSPATYIIYVSIGLLGLGFCGIFYFQAKYNQGSDNE